MKEFCRAQYLTVKDLTISQPDSQLIPKHYPRQLPPSDRGTSLKGRQLHNRTIVTLSSNLVADESLEGRVHRHRGTSRSALTLTEKQREQIFPRGFIQPMASSKTREFPESLVQSLPEMRMDGTNSTGTSSTQPFRAPSKRRGCWTDHFHTLV